MNRILTYICLLLIAIGSFLFALVIDKDNLIKSFVAVPGVISSIAVIAKIFFDSINYERQKILQSNQHMFELASQSPMAQLLFEKHAEFCKEYIARFHDVIGELFARGACEEAVNMAGKLSSVRMSYSSWISEEMAEKLIAFEDALFEIGNEHSFGKALIQSGEKGDESTGALKKASNLTLEILQAGAGKKDGSEIRRQVMLDKIREIIDVNNFFEIRKHVVSSAISFIKKSG